MILKIFWRKNWGKKCSLIVQNVAVFCKNWIITKEVKKNANIFAENWRKS
jgi:hypothetical protein